MGYWEERQEDMYKAGEMKVNQYFSRLEKAFNQTRRELRKTVESFYFRYAEENGLSYAAAQKKLDAEELGELKDYIDLVMQNIGKYNQTVNNLSIKARITRYQALEAQIDAMLRQLYAIDYQSEAEKTMQEVYEDTYYRTWYNADQYHGVHMAFAQVNPMVVETLLEYPFNGVAFSSRLWKQKDHLQAQLMEAVTTMLIQGKHPSTLTKEFAKKMQSKKFDAYRLLHTESSFLMSEAAHAGYKEDGVEKYEILATLDSKTCGVCGDLDGKVYEVGKEVVGVNMPPFHPLCRCTTVPYYDDTPTEDLTRVARDPETGKTYEVPADMTWKEWREKYINNKEDQSDIFRELKRGVEKITDHDPVSIFNLKSEYRNDLMDTIEHMPTNAKDFVKRHHADIVFINERAAGNREGAQGIRVNLKKDSVNERGRWCATFHEIGHRVDRLAGRPSEMPSFEQALKNDFDNLVKGYQKLYNINKIAAYAEISEAVRGAEFHSISDLFGGMSDNQCVGDYLHKKQGYWKKPNRLGHEAFAHFFEAYSRGDTRKTDILRETFPGAYRMFEKMMEELK